MKNKLSFFGLGILFWSFGAQAKVEMSGHVTAVTAYQHDDKDAGYGAGGVTQGDFGIGDFADADHFRFLVDEVELDVESEFGENTRLRADLDFRDIANNLVRVAGDVVSLEQAYVTTNIVVGNNIEFLVGKFNAPFGLESNDRIENVFATYTPGYAFLIPHTLSGAKIYYDFNDNWNLDFGVANNFNGGFTDSAIPAFFLRLGAVWGEEGNESFFHLGGGTSSEFNSNKPKNWDYYGAAWGNWSLGENWDLGWDYHYRQTGTDTDLDRKAMAGQLYGACQFTEAWSVQARAALEWEINANTVLSSAGDASTTGSFFNALNGTGFDGLIYSGTIGTTYQIADEAQLKLEYRFDLADPAGTTARADYHAGVAEFDYGF